MFPISSDTVDVKWWNAVNKHGTFSGANNISSNGFSACGKISPSIKILWTIFYKICICIFGNTIEKKQEMKNKF